MEKTRWYFNLRENINKFENFKTDIMLSEQDTDASVHTIRVILLQIVSSRYVLKITGVKFKKLTGFY